MEWRPIGESGAYPEWLRKLRTSRGVYAIRKRGWIFTEVLYVGESHKGTLYKTLTRHFQQWRRGGKSRKKLPFYVGQYSPSQTDPGHTYARASDIEVAIQTTKTSEAALRLQAAWIGKLKPRDNRAGVAPVEEEVPF